MVNLTTWTQLTKCGTLQLCRSQTSAPTRTSNLRFSQKSWRQTLKTKKCSLHQTTSKCVSPMAKKPSHSTTQTMQQGKRTHSSLLRMCVGARIISNRGQISMMATRKPLRRRNRMLRRLRTRSICNSTLLTLVIRRAKSRMKMMALLTLVLLRWNSLRSVLVRSWLRTPSLKTSNMSTARKTAMV